MDKNWGKWKKWCKENLRKNLLNLRKQKYHEYDINDQLGGIIVKYINEEITSGTLKSKLSHDQICENHLFEQ